MKKLIFLACLMALAVFIAAGCGDDDCPSCPADVDTVTVIQPVEYLVWLDGYVVLDPNVWMEMDGLANGGAIPDIDSFAVGDSVSTDVAAYYWWHSGDPYYYMYWVEDETAPYMYDRGAIATVTVWGDNRSSAASVVILDWLDDGATMLVPDGSDTVVDPSSNMEFTWARVPLAEWYGVELNCSLDSSSEIIERNYFYYTTDTVFTLSSTIDGYDILECMTWVQPVTGPDPESGIGNWVGDYVTGKLFSTGMYDGARVFFMEVGASKLPVRDEVRETAPSRNDIVKGVLDTYK